MDSIEQALVHFCAPALCGIKPASLVSVKKETYLAYREYVRELNVCLQSDGKHVVPVSRTEKRMLLFVYDRDLLAKKLKDPLVCGYLAEKGYPVEDGCNAVLPFFLNRLSSSDMFPHETGVFLGYPLADVIGFEKHRGIGCKYCGYWKVYGDIESAQRICTRYEQCRQLCQQWFEEGHSIPQLIDKYSARQNAA